MTAEDWSGRAATLILPAELIIDGRTSARDKSVHALDEYTEPKPTWVAL